MDDIDYDKFPVIALLTEIFKYVDTEHFSYSELSNEINLYTGGIGFSTTVTNKKEYGGYVTHFVVSAKMLDAQLDKAMELIEGDYCRDACGNERRSACERTYNSGGTRNGIYF